MSSRKFNEEELRFRRAKEEMFQILGLLEDPDRYMVDSNLTQDEKTRLLDEGQSLVAEILTAIAQLHLKETSITDNGVMVNIMLPMAEILRVGGDIQSPRELTVGPFDSAEIAWEGGDIPSHTTVKVGPFDSAKILLVPGDISTHTTVIIGPKLSSDRTPDQAGHWRLTLGTGGRPQSSSDGTLDRGEQGEGEPTH